jgi:hypothetical protein
MGTYIRNLVAGREAYPSGPAARDVFHKRFSHGLREFLHPMFGDEERRAKQIEKEAMLRVRNKPKNGSRGIGYNAIRRSIGNSSKNACFASSKL